jgi:hypothetical protein
VGDLRQLAPTREELIDAARWCREKDGAAGFFESSGVLGILRMLGFNVEAADVVGDDDG